MKLTRKTGAWVAALRYQRERTVAVDSMLRAADTVKDLVLADVVEAGKTVAYTLELKNPADPRPIHNLVRALRLVAVDGRKWERTVPGLLPFRLELRSVGTEKAPRYTLIQQFK